MLVALSTRARYAVGIAVGSRQTEVGHMDATHILHVVLEQNGVHTLYMKGGDVILFNPESGKVLSVTKLPSDEDVETARENPPVPRAPSHTLRM
jgi:hypothetical protein